MVLRAQLQIKYVFISIKQKFHPDKWKAKHGLDLLSDVKSVCPT